MGLREEGDQKMKYIMLCSSESHWIRELYHCIKHSHAGLVMATEEHCLSPVIAEAVSPVPGQIAALRVPGPHTSLVILELLRI